MQKVKKLALLMQKIKKNLALPMQRIKKYKYKSFD